MSKLKKIVIAGPGAGKTHDMITSIKESIPSISKQSNRICAVITYTNAASEEIKERLLKIGNLPKNIFIGTSHSFLIQFIIEPFAHLVTDCPIDKNYIDNVELPDPFKKWVIRKIDDKKYETAKQRQGAIEGLTRGITNKKINNFSQNGIVTYDKILQISFDLIQNERILQILSKKISHLFIDEYQDTHTYQHAIILKILGSGKCAFYCVGDPLQSIFKFSYGSSKIVLKMEYRVKTLDDSPMLKLKEKFSDSIKTITKNNRSSTLITAFLSKYTQHVGYSQESNNKSDIPVFYIHSTAKKTVCDSFYKIAMKLEINAEDEKIKFLHLANNWSFWDELKGVYNIEAIDKGNHRKSSIMQEVERCVLGSIGLTKSNVYKIINKNNLVENILSFRQFCIQVYKKIRNNEFDKNPQTQIRELFSIEFKISSQIGNF